METGAPLRLHNTLTRSVETFSPLNETVGMYTCGPTVYAYAHLGNMRAYLFADTLKRALIWKGYDVRHIMNITDVGHLTSDADEGDDKLESAASRERVSIWDVAKKYTNAFMEDIHSLNIIDPTEWTIATEYVPKMIEFAQVLDEKGFTYQLPSGLYFDTSKLDNYGELAHLSIEGLRAGARVEMVEGKKSPTDFAIWRTTPPGENRQMEWDSPWGRGAPGWHLECSVMSIEQLGNHFDIHTGGVDHIPVHHTNEIAQSEAYIGDGKHWVNNWLHCEFINLSGAKMSKSMGTTIRVTDLIPQGIHPLAYRYFTLMAHYRAQSVFSWEALEGANTTLKRLVQRVRSRSFVPSSFTSYGEVERAITSEVAQNYLREIDEAISDDLATPRIVATLSALSNDEAVNDSDFSALIAAVDALLGCVLSQLHTDDFNLAANIDAPQPEEITQLISERETARTNKDFARSDAIRDELLARGVELRDNPEGTDWEYVRK